MFTVTFPIDIGTFVITNYKDIDLTNSKSRLGRLGSISCYQYVTERDTNANVFLAMVSGYKDVWCGQYLLRDLIVATDEQVKMYEKEMRRI